jgi:MerC mercury resistance protein
MAQIQELWTEHIDRIGMVTSALCFIYCVVALSLSAVSSHFIPSEERTHRLLAVFMTIVGAATIGFGYRRHKRKRVGRRSISRTGVDLLRSILRRFTPFSRERSGCHARGQLLQDLRPSRESHVLQRLQKMPISVS